MYLGKISYLDDVGGIIQEERNEGNKHKRDDDLEHLFYKEDVTFVNVTFDELEFDDIVWFSLYKPCGGDDLVNNIKKPIFPAD